MIHEAYLGAGNWFGAMTGDVIFILFAPTSGLEGWDTVQYKKRKCNLALGDEYRFNSPFEDKSSNITVLQLFRGVKTCGYLLCSTCPVNSSDYHLNCLRLKRIYSLSIIRAEYKKLVQNSLQLKS